MTRPLSLLAACALALASVLVACSGGKTVVGTGPMIDDQRALTPFNEVTVEAPIDVTIDYGSAQQVNVYAQGQILPYISTEVKGDRLTVRTTGNVKMDDGTNVKIILPALEAVANDGPGDVRVDGFKGDKLEVTLTGPGDLVATGLTYDDIKATNDGAGNLELEGSAEDVQYDLDGPGDLNARRLMSKKAKVNNKGAGNMSLAVSDDLKANIKGAGDIDYSGQPKVDLTDDGAGSLKGDN